MTGITEHSQKAERPLFRSAMFVAVRNEAGEYLLQRRANTGFLDGYYDLVGGHLEYDESAETCAVRETKEEVGLDVNEADLRIVGLFQSDFEPGIRYINTIYETSVYQGEPTIGEPGKIDDLGWFELENFPAKLTIGTRVFLAAKNDVSVRNRYVERAEYEKMMGERYN